MTTKDDGFPVWENHPWVADGGPAFPLTAPMHDERSVSFRGMTMRAYAAIKLCVPDSGLPWLDDMIWQARRDRFAGQALAGLLANPETWASPVIGTVAADAAESTLGTLAARKGGAE